MSSSFLQIAGTCIVLALLQALAAMPWLLAINPLTRDKIRGPAFLTKWLGGAIILGAVAAAYFHSNSDPATLTMWGRIYMAFLHLQLGADLFVLLLFLQLTFLPKGGAV